MASSSSSLTLPSTHHQNQYAYEVFLSFRGDDTRYNFTDHLYKALCQRGIVTFRDDKLRRGEDISQELLTAIEESRVSIIVFSQNYASSRWCLDELVQILECRRSRGQAVRSIFYKVDPSDVRNQTGAFGDGFAKLYQSKYEDKICKWKKALKEAADSSGWHYQDDKYEAKFIDDIVGELSARVVNPSCMLHVAAHPVGLESRTEDVSRLLKLEENVNVLMVGIWGTGGIGKTTTARDMFNSILHKFEGSCFLADVRSNSNVSNGLAQLQEILLSDVLGDSTWKVNNVAKGVGLIKTRMQRKKVLLILDDVSHSNQLQNLVPSRDCFGPGSRILITTRDKRLLTAHEVDEVYEVKTLNDRQAMNLFRLNAFKTIEPSSDYLELARRAIHYAQGLPLALIVLGSLLFNRSIEYWKATIGNPHRDIQSVLKLSYDALEEEDLKEVFLDIACFFKGKNVESVKSILQACYGLSLGTTAIEQLQEKALLRLDKDGIWMHDLIEEMGKKIANPEGKPDESTRLWSYDDVKRAFSDNTGTKKIKGIYLSNCWARDEIYLNAKSFSKMKNLRYFFIVNSDIKSSGNINRLSNELRWLEWPQCPLQPFPSNFHPYKLVKFDIHNSPHITRLWDGCKNLPNLKYMDLTECKSLRKLPDLSGIPNLIELRLSWCESLAEIPHSIGSLDKLEILNLAFCTGLQEFPKIIGKLDSLRELNLRLTGVKWRIDDEKQLWLDLTTLSLRNLEILNLRQCSELVTSPRKASISSPDDDSGSLFLPKLREFSLYWCKLSSADFIGDLDCLETLNTLDLSGNNFVTLPALGKFVNLSKIELSYCDRLREIPELPPNVLEVNAVNCESLEIISMLPKSLNTVEMRLEDCCRFSECLGNDMKMMENILVNNQDSRFSLGFPSLGCEVPKWFQYCSNIPELPPNVLEVNAVNCESLERFSMLPKSLNTVQMNLMDCDRFSECLGNDMKMMENILVNNQDSRFSLGFPSLGCEVPKWFQYWNNIGAVSFEIPSKLELENLAGVAICSVIYEPDYQNLRADLSINGVHIHQYSYGGCSYLTSDHMWVGYIPLSGEIKGKLLGQWPYKCQVEFEGRGMKSCGVHLVCQPPNENSNKMVMVDEPAGESGMHTE